MKKNKQILLLSIVAILSVCTAISNQFIANEFISIVTFPFQQIALVLRMLSLHSWYGNIFACLLYGCICMIPVLYFAYRVWKKRNVHEDLLLFLVSILLFGGIYLLINPGYINQLLAVKGMEDLLKMAIGCTIWSTLICYVILRILRNIDKKEFTDISKFLRILLFSVNIVVVYSIFGGNLNVLISSWSTVTLGNRIDNTFGNTLGNMLSNTIVTNNLNITYVWLIIRYVLDCIPTALVFWVVGNAIKLVTTLESNQYSEETVASALHLTNVSKKVVIWMSLIEVLKNVIQLVFCKFILDSNYSVNFPLTSLAFVFGTMLLSKYIVDNKRLKDDNDGFI